MAIRQTWKSSGCRYGARKIWKVLNAEGREVGRTTVERLMKQHHMQGVWRGKYRKTRASAPQEEQHRSGDLVKRNFTATQPNQLWVADFTYIKSMSGWIYSAFLIDVFSRAIVGWKVSERMDTEMTLDALNQAKCMRGLPQGAIHHSDKGVQYLSTRYVNKLNEANMRPSVGKTGSSYDNALAESVIGLYKTEVIHYVKERWKGLKDVEAATMKWVCWYNKERVHSSIGYASPYQFEAKFYEQEARKTTTILVA